MNSVVTKWKHTVRGMRFVLFSLSKRGGGYVEYFVNCLVPNKKKDDDALTDEETQ